MKLKRMLAGLLVAATLCTLTVAVPAAAADQSTPFTDISDAATANAAEVLRLLGIVSGTGGGYFNPGKSLTRAEFCKMAVELLGKGGEAAAQSSRNIFLDTKDPAWNWARGYINLAASTPLTTATGTEGSEVGSDRLMMGKGNGNFGPGDLLNYAEAVTVLMRILGYSSTNVPTGGSWYDGYMTTAKSIDLTDGVSAAPTSPITRGQTAILFENLLYLPVREGKEPFLTTLGGKITAECILLDLDATMDDGTVGAVRTLSDGTAVSYKSDHAPFDPTLAGQKAKLVLDKDEKVIALQLNETSTRRTITVVRAEATYITGAGGEKLSDLTPDTIAYIGGEKKTYGTVYLNLRPGAQVTFHYSANGKLEYLFVPDVEVAAEAAVATADGGTGFSALTGRDTGFRVLKNGISASMGDVRAYDVATYDKITKTLNVSNLRLTGVYENVAPSPVTPLRVTVMGASFPVLSSAYDMLASFKIGDQITLLLTSDGQVAGAVAPSVAKSTTVGTVLSVDGSSGHAKVKPLLDLRDVSGNAVILSGTSSFTGTTAELMQGQLVTVSSSKVGQINLARSSRGTLAGELDLAKRTLGTVPLADNVLLFERVGNSAPVEISFSQLTRTGVPASKVAYAEADYAGRVSILLLDDVTGDQYVYGLAKNENDSGNPIITVEQGGDNLSVVGVANVADGAAIGVAASIVKVGQNNTGTSRMAGFVTLISATGVPRSAFEITSAPATGGEDDAKTTSPAPIGTVTIAGVSIPVAGNVACYNPTTKSWFASLDEARAYSDSLTVYYDRDPAQGGKVRLVVAK